MTVENTNIILARHENVIVDSGTSLFLMPEKDRQKLVDSVSSMLGVECEDLGLPTCTCNDKEWPDLNLSIDGQIYTIPSESYI